MSVDVGDSMLYAIQLLDRHAITGLPVLKNGKVGRDTDTDTDRHRHQCMLLRAQCRRCEWPKEDDLCFFFDDCLLLLLPFHLCATWARFEDSLALFA